MYAEGGDVVQETISANASDDTVILEFQRSDGTLVTQLIDFRNVSKHPHSARDNQMFVGGGRGGEEGWGDGSAVSARDNI
ncbi:hypothetical protein GWI33_002051 [Rhynchophorus ferrugineus]|uniref:Out at first protein BRICHOS-like domain-containing protein n=1 Tax=Rhynchophorus ferrugineus TaxID=354439 RepID=A0A834J379_RHYFE|nr:hypothetical protein GWI33_002051 [Rhynchophorus ferrugineus]